MEALQVLLLFLSTAVLLFFLVSRNLLPAPINRWFRLRYYQWELHSVLYLFTPGEKIFFNSLVLLILGLVLVGIVVYLPEHVLTISHRVLYYFTGESRRSAAPLGGLNGVADAAAVKAGMVNL